MIRLHLIGDNALIAKLRHITPATEKTLQDGLFRLVLRLQKKIQAEKLTGQVLRVQTGTLRRSITHQVFMTPQVALTGVVSTNVVYGRQHEYGFQGTLSIKAHQRYIKKAWGKSLKQSRHVAIRPHARTVKYPERSFLRSALRAMQSEVATTLLTHLNKTPS